MSSLTHKRARVAALSRSRGPDDPEFIEARRTFAEARLAEHIKRTVDAAPPLTPAQLDRLARMLRPIPTAGGDAA